MGRKRACSLRKTDYESPVVIDHDYLRVIYNGKQVVNPKTGQLCVIPANKAPTGMLEKLRPGMSLQPVKLTDSQINRCHVVGVDTPWN